MALGTKPPEEVKTWLRRIQPSDFSQRSYIVMKCPFCGEVKEFKDNGGEQRTRPCPHDWEVIEKVTYPSHVEQLGLDKLPPEELEKKFRFLRDGDFQKSTFVMMRCKDCGEIEKHTEVFCPKVRKDSDCLHDWTVVEKTVFPSRIDIMVEKKLLPEGQFIGTTEYRAGGNNVCKLSSDDFCRETHILLKCNVCGKLEETKHSG
jgi:ribosomal protein S27E